MRAIWRQQAANNAECILSLSVFFKGFFCTSLQGLRASVWEWVGAAEMLLTELIHSLNSASCYMRAGGMGGAGWFGWAKKKAKQEKKELPESSSSKDPLKTEPVFLWSWPSSKRCASQTHRAVVQITARARASRRLYDLVFYLKSQTRPLTAISYGL